VALVSLLVLLLIFAWGARPVQAANHSAIALAQEPSAGSEHSSTGEQAAKEKGEGGEDDSAQFKHSSSVQLISRLTGLDLEKAYWLAMVINFAVIAGAIFWLSKKNLPGMFRNRTALIQKSMEEARKASEDANRRLAEVEARLSRLAVEIGEMRAAAEQEAAAEEQRIKAAAEEDGRKIVESAEQEIAAAARMARHDLTAYAADLAVSLATKQIHVDAATDQTLVHNFAQQLSNGGEKKGKQ
jgi:F-type H+-transporting ATPase subunit b